MLVQPRPAPAATSAHPEEGSIAGYPTPAAKPCAAVSCQVAEPLRPPWVRPGTGGRRGIPDQPVGDHATDSALQDVMRRALDRLPHRMRVAVVLRYYADMSEAEIATFLGVSQGTVKSTVSRAVAKLRIDAELLEG